MSNRRAQLIASLEQGLHHFSVGQFEEARLFWEKALELDPGNAQAREFMLYVSDGAGQAKAPPKEPSSQPAPAPSQKFPQKEPLQTPPLRAQKTKTVPPRSKLRTAPVALQEILANQSEQNRELAHKHSTVNPNHMLELEQYPSSNEQMHPSPPHRVQDERSLSSSLPKIHPPKPTQNTGFLKSSFAQIEELLVPLEGDELNEHALGGFSASPFLDPNSQSVDVNHFTKQEQKDGLLSSHSNSHPLLGSLEQENPLFLSETIHPLMTEQPPEQKPHTHSSIVEPQGPASLMEIPSVPTQTIPKEPTPNALPKRNKITKDDNYLSETSREDLSTHLLPTLPPRPRSVSELVPLSKNSAPPVLLEKALEAQESPSTIDLPEQKTPQKLSPHEIADLVEHGEKEEVQADSFTGPTSNVSAPPKSAETSNHSSFSLNMPTPPPESSHENSPSFHSQSESLDLKTPPPLRLDSIDLKQTFLNEEQVDSTASSKAAYSQAPLEISLDDFEEERVEDSQETIQFGQFNKQGELTEFDEFDVDPPSSNKPEEMPEYTQEVRAYTTTPPSDTSSTNPSMNSYPHEKAEHEPIEQPNLPREQNAQTYGEIVSFDLQGTDDPYISKKQEGPTLTFKRPETTSGNLHPQEQNDTNLPSNEIEHFANYEEEDPFLSANYAERNNSSGGYEQQIDPFSVGTDEPHTGFERTHNPSYNPADPYEATIGPQNPTDPYEATIGPQNPADPYEATIGPQNPADPYEATIGPQNPTDPYEATIGPQNPADPYEATITPYHPADPYTPPAEAPHESAPSDPFAYKPLTETPHNPTADPFPYEPVPAADPFPYEPVPAADPFPYEPVADPYHSTSLDPYPSTNDELPSHNPNGGLYPQKSSVPGNPPSESGVLQLDNVFEEDEFVFEDADTPDAPVPSIHEQIAYLPSAAFKHQQVEHVSKPPEKASVPLPKEQSEAEILLMGAKDLLSEEDYRAAMELLELAKRQEPEHPEIVELYESCLEKVEKIYASEIQSLDLIPQVKYSMEEIMRLQIDHRVGFLISQMDGFTSLSDLIILTGFKETELIRVIGQLRDQGVLELSGS